MKELSIKEKAEAYDGNYKAYTELINRIEDVKEAIKKQNYGIAMDILCKPYPQFQVITHSELKESEDEKIRKELIEQVTHIVPNDDEVDSEGNVLPTYQKRIYKYIAWLEKQGEQNLANSAKTCKDEQKPVEWSEEYEKRIKNIEESLLAYKIIVMDNDMELANYIEKEINWLKSLKDRYTWKPSDNELEVLRLAAEKDGACLMGLYEQLKKLREE